MKPAHSAHEALSDLKWKPKPKPVYPQRRSYSSRPSSRSTYSSSSYSGGG